MDVDDDALGLVLERVDSHVSLIRAAAVCKRWRRAIANAAFLRRYRTLHAPPVAGHYRNERPSQGASHGRPVFVPLSPSVVDARRFSLDFLPDGAGSWIIFDSRGSLLLLGHVDFDSFPVKLRDIVVCEPLTRRCRRINPSPDFDFNGSVTYLIDGEGNEAGSSISMSNFRVLCMFECHGVMQAAMYTGSSWSVKSIDHMPPSDNFAYPVGRTGGCWYFVQDGALSILDGSTGAYSSSELPPPVENWSHHRWHVDFFITHGQDGKLRIFTVFDDTMKVFIRLEGGKWVLEKGVLLSEATRGLPGYKSSFFSGRPQYVLTIGTEFVILQAMDVWTFSVNLKTMEVAPAVEDMGLLLYGCELPWPPTLHACLDI